MVNPRTVNQGIIVPLTGVDVDTWGSGDINPNMVAIDGLLAGVQTLGVGSSNVTLTSPAGFTPTPGPGPTQAQNRVFQITGAMSANVTFTLPLPGVYVFDNKATGNFYITLRTVAATETIGLPPGSVSTVYCDGIGVVRFIDQGKPGDTELWAGLASLPSWFGGCTVSPYLLCDGAIYPVATYPVLGARLLGVFGGNGSTTFAVPDLRGRMPLAYDGTGGRITAAGCGINGQLLGAALDQQVVTLTTNQLPSHYHPAGIFDPTHTHGPAGSGTSAWRVYGNFQSFTSGIAVAGIQLNNGTDGSFAIANAATGVRVNSSNGLDTTYSTGGGQFHNNVQPSLVTGIWVIKT